MSKHKQMLTLLRKYWPEVRQVVDATRKLIIHVEPEDVSGATPRDAENCVVARACKREQDVDAVLVFSSRAYILQGTLATRFDVPETVTREIVVLDRGGALAPGKYHFGPPPKAARLGFYNSSKKSGKQDGSWPRSKPAHFTEGLRASLHSSRAPVDET